MVHSCLLLRNLWQFHIQNGYWDAIVRNALLSYLWWYLLLQHPEFASSTLIYYILEPTSWPVLILFCSFTNINIFSQIPPTWISRFICLLVKEVSISSLVVTTARHNTALIQLCQRVAYGLSPILNSAYSYMHIPFLSLILYQTALLWK